MTTTSKMNMRVAALAVIMVLGVWLSKLASAATSSVPGNCLTNIATSCSFSDNASPTAAQIQPCCDALKSAINDDKACFCLIKTQMDDPSTKDAFTNVFNVCSIRGSVDSICSGSDSSNTGSSPTGSGAKGLKGNAGNKIEMKSVSSLLIALICLLVMRSI